MPDVADHRPLVVRHGQIVAVRPERREDYLRLHAAVWPEVEERLTASNITNYTIFIHGNLLFSYFEYVGEDYQADLARIAADPVTQQWWTHTDPCQVPVDGAPDGTVWADAQQVWHLD
jgi:L-rhamnose mutarotase